jgi:hypothetical protein
LKYQEYKAGKCVNETWMMCRSCVMLASDRTPAWRPVPLSGPGNSRRCARCGVALPARDFREALTLFGLGPADQPLLTCVGEEED